VGPGWWPEGAFSGPIPFEDKKAIEDVASYLVKAPLSLKKLVYLDGQRAVVYRSKMNPALGRNFEAMDPLEWLARLADHIPDPGKHRTLAYGHYANRARGARAKEKDKPEGTPAEAPKKRRCSPNWARLISKVYHADPLVCRRCGGRLAIVAITRLGHDRPLGLPGLRRRRGESRSQAMARQPGRIEPCCIRRPLHEHGETWGSTVLFALLTATIAWTRLRGAGSGGAAAESLGAGRRC
jgi:hypothetical protein